MPRSRAALPVAVLFLAACGPADPAAGPPAPPTTPAAPDSFTPGRGNARDSTTFQRVAGVLGRRGAVAAGLAVVPG